MEYFAYIFNGFVAVAAVFTLAYKLQPAIIFIDEVDSFLGQRRNTDHEAMTNMKTEFMSLWDGFTTDCEYSIFLALFIVWMYVIFPCLCGFLLISKICFQFWFVIHLICFLLL